MVNTKICLTNDSADKKIRTYQQADCMTVSFFCDLTVPQGTKL